MPAPGSHDSAEINPPTNDGFAGANKTERILDLGYCLVRMNVTAEHTEDESFN
jgi:hypothetical protein